MNDMFESVTLESLALRVQALEEALAGKPAKPTVCHVTPPPALKPAWDRWNAYRTISGKWTEDARRVNLKKLCDLSQGKAPMAEAIVEQSIERGYTGLFPLKEPLRAVSSAPRPMGAKAALEPSEKPLERDLAYARQRLGRGEFGEGEAAQTSFKAECARIAAKHRAKQS